MTRGTLRLLAVVAAIAAVVAAGFVVLSDDDGPDEATASPDTSSDVSGSVRLVPRGSVVFAADAGAGADLTTPIDHGRVETVPEPMDLYVAQAGAPIRRLVATGAHERCPAFSPDGERLAYLSAPGTRPESSYAETGAPLDASIVVLRLDGTSDSSDSELEVPVPVAPGYGVRRGIGYACPQWSPNSRRLAYLAHPVGDGQGSSDVAELRVVDLDGRDQVLNAAQLADREAPFAWSPEGDAIAYVRSDGVWTATLDRRRPSRVWQPDGTPTAVSWSSQGELAVTVRTEVPVEGGTREDLEVHVVDPATGAASAVGPIHVYDGPASWSPDGTRLAFVRGDGQIGLRDHDASPTVVPAPISGEHPVELWDVGWSADGDRLLALAREVHFDATDPRDRDTLGLALLTVSTDGTHVDHLTPWTWSLDWINLRDVTSHPSA
jgi:Tol biopolymer transport system component